MSSLLTLRCSIPANANLPVNNDPMSTLDNLQLMIDSMKAGRLNPSTMKCDIGQVAATDSVAIADASGTVSITINGVAFSTTADADDTVTAAALAAAINASTNALIQGQVAAVAAGADHAAAVLLTATGPAVGSPGNFITLAAAGTGMTASAARFTGGLDSIAAAAAVQATAVFTISSGSGQLIAYINGSQYALVWASSDSATGDALAAAINASPPVDFPVHAVNAAGVVTVTSIAPGGFANSIPISSGGTGSGFTRSGSYFTGGADAIEGTAQVAAAAASDVVTISGGSGAVIVTVKGQAFWASESTDAAYAASLATAILSNSGILPYTGETGSFTAGLVLTGAVSGATGVIAKDVNNSATGALHMQNVVGNFLPGEAITDSSTGVAVVGPQGLQAGVQGKVIASSALGLLTVSASLPGTGPNSYTITATGTGASSAHATLVGGAAPVNYNFSF